MKKFTYKLLSILLTLAMVVSMVPMFGVTASAGTEVYYLSPVYKTSDIPSSGIDYWEKLKIDDNYTYINSRTTNWDWEAGWYVVDGTVVVSQHITVEGAVHLILMDGCSLTVKVTGDYAGIENGTNAFTVYAGNTISNIDGTGMLTAEGSNAGAGIGGGYRGSGSNITINGGKVTATSGFDGAGIGGGHDGSGSNITINGGTVTAKSGYEGAGIGGGAFKSGSNITINGGTVTAKSGDTGAGIGGGRDGSGSNITINGGTVTAKSDYYGAGIGGGYRGSCSNITINGGAVTATGAGGGAGIGNGNETSTNASNIFVDDQLVLRAGSSSKDVQTIEHTGTTDLADNLKDKAFAEAKKHSVTYLDENGEEKTLDGKTAGRNYTLISGDQTNPQEWSAGYYVVGADNNNDGVINADDATAGTHEFTISNTVTVSGNVKLILADGFTLNVAPKIEGKSAITVTTGEGNLFTVYAQTNGTGTLTATGANDTSAKGGNGINGAVTINGGSVIAKSGTGGSASAIAIENNSTFVIGANSQITADGSVTNSGTITVDMTDATAANVTLIDASANSNYGAYDFAEGKANGYILKVVDNDLCAVKAVASITKGDPPETTYYETLTAAVTEAEADDTIKLLGDITLSEDLVINKTIALDLNDHIISGNGVYSICNKHTLQLVDNSEKTAIRYWVSNADGLWTLKDVRPSGILGTDYYTTAGGCITGLVDFSTNKWGGICNNGTLTIKDVDLVGNTSDMGGAVYNFDDCILNIENSEVMGNTAVCVAGGIANRGTATITNSKIACNKSDEVGGIWSKAALILDSTEVTRNFTVDTDSDITDNNYPSAGVYSYKGTVTLKNKITVKGNKSQIGTSTNENANLVIAGDVLLDVTDLVADSDIGISKLTSDDIVTFGKFTTNGTADDVKYFHSDSNSYYVKHITEQESGHLELAVANIKIADGITGGTITISDQGASTGKTVTVTATPNSGYRLDKITVTDKDGTDITAEALNGTTITVPATEKLPITVSAVFRVISSGGGGGSSSPTVNVPVSGDKDTIKVTATVSGSTATVKNITADEIATAGTGSSVTMDLSGLSKTVTGVTVPKTTFENIAASEATGLEIKMPNGTTVVFDKETLSAVAAQAKGANIQLVIDKDTKAESSMTSAQKETVKEMNNAVVLDAHFVSNGTRISDFKGGEAELTAEYSTDKAVKVWFVAEDGAKTEVPCTWDGKTAKFTVGHFSHYVIETVEESKQESTTTEGSTFTDVNSTDYFYEPVLWAAKNGITGGMDATHFAPNGITTRAQMVTFLWRHAGSPEPTTASCPFTDVDSSAYYYKAVLWAVEKGITEGTSAATFSPEEKVSRCQAVTFLWRYNGSVPFTNMTASGPAPSPFSDVATNAYYYSAVLWAKAQGITDGTSATTFSPDDDCTRGQIVTFLYRSVEK